MQGKYTRRGSAVRGTSWDLNQCERVTEIRPVFYDSDYASSRPHAADCRHFLPPRLRSCFFLALARYTEARFGLTVETRTSRSYRVPPCPAHLDQNPRHIPQPLLDHPGASPSSALPISHLTQHGDQRHLRRHRRRHHTHPVAALPEHSRRGHRRTSLSIVALALWAVPSRSWRFPPPPLTRLPHAVLL